MLQNEAMSEFLRDEILEKGPMDMATFMEHVLAHPTLGYYRRQDPFGELGDFMTSPEISQLFGEMIGAWVADIWMQLGSPESFDFVEVGPGRGTLMVDMMRATKNVVGFHEAAQIHLVETSPVLRIKQSKMLKDYNVSWHERCEDIEAGRPMIMIGNEFLAALPIHQLVKTKGGWSERVVTLTDVPEKKKPEGIKGILQEIAPNLLEGEEDFLFAFKEQKACDELLKLVPDNLPGAPDGNIFEVSPQRDSFIKVVSAKLKQDNGAALFIDYGEKESKMGNSMHAIFRHAHVDILKNPGHADLSSNVDFGAVARAAEAQGSKCSPAIYQGDFLKNLGVEARVEALMPKANKKQREELQIGLHRLTDLDQMGDFLVMGIYNGKGKSGTGLKPAGF